MNNVDKHRALFTVAFSLSTFSAIEWETVETASLSDCTRIEEGSELLRVPATAKQSSHMNFSFDIAIQEPGIIKSVPLIYILRSSYMAVIETVESFGGI